MSDLGIEDETISGQFSEGMSAFTIKNWNMETICEENALGETVLNFLYLI